MSEDHKKQLEQQLWNIANTLRGKMNADEFRDYILGFIFYKYLAEKMEIYANKILKEGGDTFLFSEIDENTETGKEYIEAIKEESLEKLGYFLKPSELFSAISKRGNHNEDEKESDAVAEDTTETYNTKDNFILEDLQKILNNIQNSTMGTDSEEDFEDLFEDMDLNSTKLGKSPEARNEIIAKVLAHLDKIDFKLENTELDVLGDAYEYLIGKFASGAGKKAGEFYTPQEVSMVLAKLVTTGKKKLKSVYDPTCGSGSLLLRVAKEVDEVNNFYGQELNRTTYNLARMNMILHGVHYRKFDIKQEDTLEHPQHLEHRFEAIVANPPFSARWSANQLFMSDDRFSQYGKLAPKSKADFAFVQHMIHQLAENGTMALVLPHGVLFRSGAEEHIRKYIVKENNFLDAVIGLPADIFYGTGIPTCILVFKKCRENPEDILFIDASSHFEKVKMQNMLREVDINNIVDTYRERKTKEKYSYLAPIDEVAENDYNLSIRRYVDTFVEEQKVDIIKVTSFLNEIHNLSKVNEEELLEFCNELQLPFPYGSNISLLKEYKKGVSQKIYNQKLRFKDETGSDFPNWQEKRLSDFLIERNIKAPKNKEYPLMAFIANKGVAHKGKRYNREFLVNDSSNKKYKQTEYGDFIYSSNNLETGSIGLNKYGSASISPVYSIFEIDKTCDYRFMGNFLVRKEFLNKMIRYRQGVVYGQWRIHESDFLKIVEKVPHLKEQIKIAKFLSAIDTKIEFARKKIEYTELEIDNLSRKMFG